MELPRFGRPHRHWRRAVVNHQFADVPGLPHVPEGRDCLGGRMDGHRQRLEFSRLESLGQTPQQFAHPGRPLFEELIEVDPEEGDVVPEGVEAEGLVGVDVSFADFQEPATDG